jgi:hypothetical protein
MSVWRGSFPSKFDRYVAYLPPCTLITEPHGNTYLRPFALAGKERITRRFFRRSPHTPSKIRAIEDLS